MNEKKNNFLNYIHLAIFASSEDPKPIHVRAPRVEEVLDTTVRVHMLDEH